MDSRRSKLKYRAWHRGFREADLILGPFADARLASMAARELDAFEALLEQPDHDLYGWILGEAPAPPAFEGEVLSMIRRFHSEARHASEA